MKNWLNSFSYDMGELSKGKFFLKYILPGLALFFSWGLAGHIYLINLDKNSLIAKKGKVAFIAVKYEKGIRFYSTYHPLILGLYDNNNFKEFRIPDNYESSFSQLQSQILKGDVITLYTRKKWQTILGWGNQADIYQIDKNGKSLFDISIVINEKKREAILYSILILILWPWYIYYRFMRHQTLKVTK